MSVVPPGNGQRWQLQFSNTSSGPLELSVDRRLIRLEISPPIPVATLGRRMPRRPQMFTCKSPLAGQSTIELARTTILAGQQHQEPFDLLAVCGLRVGEKLVPGASLQFYYGTARRSVSASRALVFGGPATTPAVNELAAQAAVVVPMGASWIPVPPVESSTESAMTANVVRHAEGATADAVRLSVTLAARLQTIETVYFRPGMVSIEIVSPDGTRSTCSDAPRGYVGLRDYLRTFRHRATAVGTMNLGHMCSRPLLDEPGMYLVRARFGSTVASSDGSRATFSGTTTSRWVWVRIVRGRSQRAYVPLAPSDPFAAAMNSGS